MPLQIYHPPKPRAIKPVEVEITVITAEVAAQWALEIAAGERPPYAYMAFSEAGYLLMGQYFDDIERFAKEVDAIIMHYRSIGGQNGEKATGQGPDPVRDP